MEEAVPGASGFVDIIQNFSFWRTGHPDSCKYWNYYYKREEEKNIVSFLDTARTHSNFVTFEL